MTAELGRFAVRLGTGTKRVGCVDFNWSGLVSYNNTNVSDDRNPKLARNRWQLQSYDKVMNVYIVWQQQKFLGYRI